MPADDDERVVRVRGSIDSSIDMTLDGVLANLTALENKPADRAASGRVGAHLVELERPWSIRTGLREGGR